MVFDNLDQVVAHIERIVVDELDNVGEKMEEIMNEMRKDLGLRRVKKGNLLAFFVNDIKEVLKAKK